MSRLARTDLWMPLSILLLTWGIYLNSLGNGFHFDDTHSIVENRSIRAPGNIPRFFVDPRTFSPEPAMAMYRPVLLTSYALNYGLHRYHPWGYHLVNVVLHGLMALGVFWLLKGLGIGRLAWWGGALFGLHPIHAQAVNYISSRSELLAGLGVLAGFYLAGVAGRKKGLALGAWGIGLLSKSVAIVLIPLLAMRERFQRRENRRWKGHLPFWGMGAIYLGIITVNRFLPRSLSQEVRPLSEQIFTQLKGLVYYLLLSAMPVRLSIEHEFAVSHSPLDGAVLGSVALLGSLIYLVFRRGRGAIWARWGVGWYLIGLSLTFLVPLNVLVSEHRLYLASIGILIAVLGYLERGKTSSVLRWSACGLLLVLAVLTWERNRVWEDEFSLWGDAVARAPGMFRAQSNWGLALYERRDLDGALVAFARALELNPAYGKTWNNLGLVYEEMGRFGEALEAYEKGLELRGDLAGTHVNLGRLNFQLGKVGKGEAHLEQALEIAPLSIPARVNLGLVRQQQGRYGEAVEEYQKVLLEDPHNAEALNNLGLTYGEMGEDEMAHQALEKAVGLREDYLEAQINLKVIQLRAEGVPRREIYTQLTRDYPDRTEVWVALGEEMGRAGSWEDAGKAYARALEQDPGLQGIYLRLGGAYRHLGQLEEAIGIYESGLGVEGDSLALFNNLASAYAAVGRLAEAIDVCQKILAVDSGDARARDNLEKLVRRAAGE
ncbi:MAG: tetratricopeptide repeat protein [Gemmatimonadetes bacterium]|nr:tetratricopeptide repeat protein [Gemmatimonadota bacterium]